MFNSVFMSFLLNIASITPPLRRTALFYFFYFLNRRRERNKKNKTDNMLQYLPKKKNIVFMSNKISISDNFDVSFT